MRTPAAMIVGLVLAPCGLVLTLTCTFAPDWRLLRALPGEPTDLVEHQGIWDVCTERGSTHARLCGVDRPLYTAQVQVQVARGLMLTSLLLTLLAIALASMGVRCWQDQPQPTLAGLGGLLIFLSGVLSLIPVSWYTNQIASLAGVPPGATTEVGYSLVLGYIGSCFEILGGLSLTLSLVQTCKEWRRGGRGKAPPADNYSKQAGLGGVGLGPPYYRDPGAMSSAYTIDYSVRRDTAGGRPDPRDRDFRSPVPRSYTNPMDVTAGEMPYRGPAARPRSQLSSLPCDSDLL